MPKSVGELMSEVAGAIALPDDVDFVYFRMLRGKRHRSAGEEIEFRSLQERVRILGDVRRSNRALARSMEKLAKGG